MYIQCRCGQIVKHFEVSPSLLDKRDFASYNMQNVYFDATFERREFMATIINEPAHTFNEYLLIPG